MLMKFKTTMTLYNSYFDANDNISIKKILEIFQDVASIHAEDLGVGYMAMLEKKLYWVLSRIKIDILKMPQINQTVVVETWPHVKGRIDFDRDIKISAEDGTLLVIGTSKWCVIDTQTRILQRTDNVAYTGEYVQEICYEERFGKIVLPNADIKEKFVHKVRFSDLDHNKHMNNTNYANLVLNAVDNKTIRHFEINFNNEGTLGEEIVVCHVKYFNGEFVVGKTKNQNCFLAFIK